MAETTCKSAKVVNCPGSCGSQAANGVDDSCKGCKDGCNAACAPACTGDCWQNCGGCGNCKDDCSGGSSGERVCTGCSTNCGLGCGGDCTSGCKSSLKGVCGDCTNQCRGCGSCGGGCEKNCVGSCSGDCLETCTDVCADNCSGGCKNGCGNTCTHESAASAYSNLINIGLHEVITAQDIADLETLVYAETRRRRVTPTVSLTDAGVEQNKLTVRLDIDAIYNDLSKVQSYPRNTSSPWASETIQSKENDVATKDKITNYIHVVTSLYGVMISES